MIQEHLLSAPPDVSTDRLVFHFAEGDQDQILAATRGYKDLAAQSLAYNRRALESFGYILKTHQKSENGFSYETIEIDRGDQLLARDIITMQPVSLNASQARFISFVDLSDGTYVFTRDGLEMQQPGAVGNQPYAYVGNRLLSLELTAVSPGVSRLRAYLDDQPAFDVQFNNVSTYGSFDGPWSYGNHWALVLLDAKGSTEQGWEPVDRLIQDGQNVNAINGYEQTFEFSVLGGRPFYFYQKEARIGISFNGQEISEGYDEIPHYGCCTPAILNPGRSMNMVWFFARRGAAWYYVEAYVSGH